MKKKVVKTLIGLAVFAVFLTALSPVYVHRSAVLRLTYVTVMKTPLNIHCLRTVTDPNPDRFSCSEPYILMPSEKPKMVSLELPADNRLGCLLFSFPETTEPIQFRKASVVLHGKEYPVSFGKCVIGSPDKKRVKYSDDIMTLRPGKKINIRFFFDDFMKIHREVDYVELLYMVLLSLFPAVLAFRKANFSLNRKTVWEFLYSFIVIFFLIFPALLIDYYGILSKENRLKNKFPSVFLHHRFNDSFPKQLENWFEDRFTGRDSAIRNEKKIFSQDFDSFSGTKVIYGSQQWVFGKTWDAVAMYQNKNRFTEDQLKTCARNVKLLDDFCRKRKIRLYIMLTPDKERVYPEYYPKNYRQLHPESRLEQLAYFLRANTPVKIVFPLPGLLESKKQYPVYFKTGTHWSFRGAHVGALALLREIKKDFPDLPMDQPNAMKWKKTPCADMDLMLSAGYSDPKEQLPQKDFMYDEAQIVFPFHSQELEEKSVGECYLTEHTAKTALPGSLRMFVCADSFWWHLLRFMFPAANKILHASFERGSKFALEFFQETVEEFHPDVMVIESTERFLDRFLTLHIEGN